MKKFLPLLLLWFGLSYGLKAQCVVNTHDQYLGLLPVDSTILPITTGVFYDTIIQAYSPDTVKYLGTASEIYWTYIDTILGFPTGITYSKNPTADTIYAPGHQCIYFSGTTTDTPGVYQLVFVGTIHISSPFLGADTVLTIQELDSDLLDYGVNSIFSYGLVVQAPYVQTCSIDSPGLALPGVLPAATDLPCVVQTVPYNETVQSKNQTTAVFNASNIIVDSLMIDSIAGLPAHITWGASPAIVQGGGNNCVNFAGTTSAATGTYALTLYGTAWYKDSANQSSPHAYTGNLNQFSSLGGYYLRVVSTSDSCTLTAGINNYFSGLNAEVNVFPNPNNGVFELKINAASPVTGKVLVFDELGRGVYEQFLDALGVYSTAIDLSKFGSGLYTLQIRTPQGYASKKISVQ